MKNPAVRPVVAVLLALTLLSGCASGGVGEFAAVAERSCDLYRSLREDVVAVKPVIAAGFDSYPPEVQVKLLKINALLPKLDAIGKASCLIATPDEGHAILREGGVDGWGTALTILKGVAPVFLDLKRAGVI